MYRTACYLLKLWCFLEQALDVISEVKTEPCGSIRRMNVEIPSLSVSDMRRLKATDKASCVHPEHHRALGIPCATSDMTSPDGNGLAPVAKKGCSMSGAFNMQVVLRSFCYWPYSQHIASVPCDDNSIEIANCS
jgi:hypothetical protein